MDSKYTYGQRGTGILNNQLYVGLRPYGKQTYRKNPDTGRRHAFLNPEEIQADVIEVPDLRIVPQELWEQVKTRQATLARPNKPNAGVSALPFFEQQRPKFLLTGKMVCGTCGASYAKSGKHRFGCQGAAKKGPTWCDNRLTIRQDELDTRVLAGLAVEMLRDNVVAAFLAEYEAEANRLAAETVSARPEREVELANLDHQMSIAKAAILKGVDATVFVEDMKRWNDRRKFLLAEQDTAPPTPGVSTLLPANLGTIYREKVGSLTSAFHDDALRAQAFERLRNLIDGVVLTPDEGELAINLRGELAAMLELCAKGRQHNAPLGVTEGALQIKLVAGTGFEPVTFRL